MKKYEILSRHREVQPPPKPELTVFLEDPTLHISNQIYELFINTCHYVCISKLSGEYGYGAFDVFSNNLDFFFNELNKLSNSHALIVSAAKPSELSKL